MTGEITHEDLDYFERTLEALALELKISDAEMFNLLAIHGACVTAAVDKEREMSQAVNENPTIEEQTWYYGKKAADEIEQLRSALKPAMRRTSLEKDANDFDADLYRLVDRAYQYADRYQAKRTVWLKVAGHLSGQRPDVRLMMHREDQEQTK